ncbi:MAG TPA: hypothetical protein VF040_01295, partial [Ktedonobacterales bacterium]
MQQPHIRQKKHRERVYAQRLGAKSRQTKFRRPLLIAVLGWVMVLAAAAVTVVGSGQLPWAAAAPSAARAQRPPDRGSEARLGKKHGQMRQSGCSLIVPQQPLTAQGLATPYQFAGRANGQPCRESNTDVSAFVQAAILDPATGQISIYNPLVVDQGTQPAAAPVVPTLPANAVVGIWFGSNGDTLSLQGASAAALRDGNCVGGLGGSVFGQVAYCNAPAFFTAANQQIQMKKLTPPALGTSNDGQICPTVRDFSVVDQDQSDNVTTTYLLTQDGKVAQDTAANAANLAGSAVLKNGSDNRLLTVALDTALGCTSWKAPDLANPGQMVPAQPLAELQAAMYQAQPVALVPSGDPMVLVNGRPNLAKQNLYRAGVDQPAVASAMQAQADNLTYCQNLLKIAPARIQMDKQWTVGAPTLDPGVANNLYTFLAARFDTTIGPDQLNCTGLLKQPSPVKLVQRNGVVVDATFTVTAPMTMPPQQGQAQGQAGAQNGATPAPA